MAAHFTIAGVEITQGLQYYHSKDHLLELLDQGADNSLPLIANKRTWVRVYLECDSGYTANVSGAVTVSNKIGDNGEWSKFAPLSELDRIRGDGKGTINLFSGKWTTGWTNIVAFLLGGKPYLFSYKAGDGTVAFDRVNA